MKPAILAPFAAQKPIGSRIPHPNIGASDVEGFNSITPEPDQVEPLRQLQSIRPERADGR